MSEASVPTIEAALIDVGDRAWEVRRRLREIRRQKSLSLQDVERLSDGVWKAATLGAYERGDRGLRPGQLAALAEFYGVPVTSLWPEAVQVSNSDTGRRRIRIDLSRLENVPDSEREGLERFTDAIREQRGDYGADLLTIRYGDISVLSLLLEKTPDRLLTELEQWNILTMENS